MELGSLVARQLERSAERLLGSLDGFTPEEAETRPHDLTPVVWHVGHLAVHNAKLLQAAGYAVDIPEKYMAVFHKGTDGRGPFPPLDEVTAFYRQVQEQLIRLATDRDKHQIPMEGSAWSTVGEGLLWMHNHCGYHVGKISTLRALLGKPMQR